MEHLLYMSVSVDNDITVYTIWQLVFSLVLKPPLIKGETTVSEGDTLHLTCDVSDSRPLPSIKWVYPGGQTFTRDLEISNIMRNMSGTYTCIATHTTFSDATMNISVHITILCECVKVHFSTVSYYYFQSTVKLCSQQSSS